MTRSSDDAPETLASDASFVGLTATQFLGAFNDNAFKQLVLLLAIDAAAGDPDAKSYQPIALALFSLPFVLFSGLAGSLADRVSKTRIVIWMKILEIVVMAVALVAFLVGNFAVLMAALFFMATQSTFFGPGKYGILPEMLRPKNLSKANGIIQMTTFLAIIGGLAAGGGLKDLFKDRLYIPGSIFVAIAVAGTCTSLLVRRIPPAMPELAVFRNPFGDLWPTLRRAYRDGALFFVLMFYSYFWFVGSVVAPTMNLYGESLMKLSATGTSFLLVSLSMGMVVGFPLGGYLSRGRVELRLTNAGILGVVVLLGGLTFLDSPESLWLTHGVLFLLGASAALFALPLQTFIQIRPPEGEKGRVIGAMNFVNFFFMLAAAGYQYLAERYLAPQYIPLSLAILTGALAIWVIPRLTRLARTL